MRTVSKYILSKFNRVVKILGNEIRVNSDFLNHLDWSGIKVRFIISTGRTGTKFLVIFFDEFYSNIYACHEPYPDLLKLGIEYAKGEISLNNACKIFDKNRKNILYELDKRNKKNYIESNSRLFPLIPVIRKICENYKVVHIIRDGRDWVRSVLPRSCYRREDPFQRLSADEFPEDPYFTKWDKMSRFEKICWLWVKMDRFIYDSIKEDKKSITIKFEDIFDAERDYIGMRKIIDFLDLDPEKSIGLKNEKFNRFMRRKINVTKYPRPHWRNWSIINKEAFLEICGAHMKLYEYDLADFASMKNNR